MEKSTVKIKIKNKKQLDDLLDKLECQVRDIRRTMQEIGDLELEVGVDS